MKDQERTPLRTILLNFLNHIENLEAHRSPEDSYETEFQELKLFSETLKTLKSYSCSEGEKEVNRKKNRYKDILPFDLSRVILNEYAGIPGSDYINANYIKGASGSPAYIASQGPLPHTVNDFWRMVVQCEVQVIVMACNEEEAGKHKCENYWVEGEGEEKQFGMVTIRLIKASTVCPDFSVRTMRLKYTNTQSNTEERTVCQFHYSAWPDHGVPPLVRPLLDMVRLVRDTQASETLPVLVHCSAGCGRTGTICAIDYVWGLLRAGKLTKDFSLLSLVREMRKQRIAMVQTKEQYVLVHRAVRELFKEQLRMIDSHPYENIDCNGMPIDTEPTYDTICDNNSTEEKTNKDDKEKEVAVIAPPLPQKKRFPVASSKHEKEVENLSEKQRIAEQAESSNESNTSGSGSGHRPRIAKLKSLFERESKQVSRSHSLGAPRKPQVIKKEPIRPIPSHGILRHTQLSEQSPALPVKRSKSLRVLGSSDRYKLSIPSAPPPVFDDRSRRLSLESNMDVHEKDDVQEGKKYFSKTNVDLVVAGLAVRERRNSFREAVSKTGQDYEKIHRKPVAGLVRSYTAIDIRPLNRHEFEVKVDKSNPVIRPKPSFLNSREAIATRSLVNPDVLRQNEKAEFLKQQRKMPVPKSDYINSPNISINMRKDQVSNTFTSTATVNSKSPLYPGSIMKGSSKKDKDISQPPSQQSDNIQQQYPLSSSSIPVEGTYGTSMSPQEGLYRKNSDAPHVWRHHLPQQQQQHHHLSPFASEKRLPNKVLKSPRVSVQQKPEQNHREQTQMNSTVDFDKELHTTPSYSDSSMHYGSPSISKQMHSSQPQALLRFHNARHVVFDSRFSGQEGKSHSGLRHLHGTDLGSNEKLRGHPAQKPRQLYQEISSPHVYQHDNSSKFSGRHISVVDGSHNHPKTPVSSQGGPRQNLMSVDQRHVQHFSDVKTNSGSVGAGVVNDSRFNSKTVNSSEFRVVSDLEHLGVSDPVLRSSGPSADQYRSPSLYATPSRQQAPFNSRSQMTPGTESDLSVYGGLKLRRGSQDDLALCSASGSVTPSRVKRNASVVLRHSFIESSEASPQLTVWNSPQSNGGDVRGNSQNGQFNKESEDPWSGAVGVDLDQVAASMTSQKDGSSSKLMKAALQALHQRKGVSPAVDHSKTPDHKYGSIVQAHSTPTQKTVTMAATSLQPPFRKQQQYL